ncbi:unnamed protein product [Boreogadus saida]
MHYLGENGLSMRRVILTEKEKDEVKTCMSCQRFEHVKTEAPELKPIKPKSPWHMIATDFFTKWVEARPIKDKTAIATSQVIANIEKAQETERGIQEGDQALQDHTRHGAGDLGWKASEDQDTYASVKPVRRRSQAAWPTKETVQSILASRFRVGGGPTRGKYFRLGCCHH